MSARGPIILIEDDMNDVDVITAALEACDCTNGIHTFLNAKDALAYFATTSEQPFIILCDIHLPGMNGLELRNIINQNDFLRRKSIPFIYYTALVSNEIICEAYDLTVQGFFKKSSDFNEMKQQMSSIVNYWSMCMHPNSFMKLM